MKRKNQQLGMTLVELLFALSVLSVLVSLTTAGFSTLRSQIRMNNGVNGLVHSFHMAKQQSHTGATASVCKSMDGIQCMHDSDWSDGWLVFLNLDNDDPPFIDAGETVLEVHESVRPLSLASNRASYSMRPPGRRSTNGTLIWCSPDARVAPRSVVVSYTGKPRVSIYNDPPPECADDD
jgi:type IV fimbrial biogenesis protein FimT